VTFRLRHLDGRFPNWRAVLPCSFESTWKVRVDALAATVDRAARLASRENRSVDLAVADAKLLLEVGRVSRRNAFAYRGEVPVDGALPGESPGVSLDVTYLQDGLKAFEKAGIAEAHCRYIDPKSPFRLDTYRGETPGPSYILMPLNRDR
jgi:DNA polymerase III sliding clamp (beta) subunit (PCNA family)